MKYWRINTDKNARSDKRTCDIWYKYNLAFAGDFEGKKGEHDRIFRKLQIGDGIFMHESGSGIIGFGIVTENWNKKIFEKNDRILYREEIYEYRIIVQWDSNYDCRNNPLSITNRLPYMGTYSQVNLKTWDIQSVFRELKVNRNI